MVGSIDAMTYEEVVRAVLLDPLFVDLVPHVHSVGDVQERLEVGRQDPERPPVVELHLLPPRARVPAHDAPFEAVELGLLA